MDLLLKFGASPHAIPKKGTSLPIVLALNHNLMETAELLANRGAHLNDDRDSIATLAIKAAYHDSPGTERSRKNKKCLLNLLKKGMSPLAGNFNCTSIPHSTFLISFSNNPAIHEKQHSEELQKCSDDLQRCSDDFEEYSNDLEKHLSRLNRQYELLSNQMTELALSANIYIEILHGFGGCIKDPDRQRKEHNAKHIEKTHNAILAILKKTHSEDLYVPVGATLNTPGPILLPPRLVDKHGLVDKRYELTTTIESLWAVLVRNINYNPTVGLEYPKKALDTMARVAHKHILVPGLVDALTKACEYAKAEQRRRESLETERLTAASKP